MRRSGRKESPKVWHTKINLKQSQKRRDWIAQRRAWCVATLFHYATSAKLQFAVRSAKSTPTSAMHRARERRMQPEQWVCSGFVSQNKRQQSAKPILALSILESTVSCSMTLWWYITQPSQPRTFVVCRPDPLDGPIPSSRPRSASAFGCRFRLGKSLSRRLERKEQSNKSLALSCHMSFFFPLHARNGFVNLQHFELY